MSLTPLSLGPVPAGVDLGWWILTKAIQHRPPWVDQILADPMGAVSRIGDVLVWQGPTGHQVLAGLETVAESQARIEHVIGTIEAATIATSTGVSALTSLSMLGLGFGALATGLLHYRLNAINERLSGLSDSMQDVLDKLTAKEPVPLQSAMDHLTNFDQDPDKNRAGLQQAIGNAINSTNNFRNLVNGEIKGKKRLKALNQYGRYYVLSVAVQMRCFILDEQPKLSEDRFQKEEAGLRALAQAMFDQVLREEPERYLDPTFRRDNVTLGLLGEIYQQAKHAGVETGTDAKTPSDLFETLREKVGRSSLGGWFTWNTDGIRDELLRNLKYLVACLEEVNWLRAFRYRIEMARKQNTPLPELEAEVRKITNAVARDSSDDVIAFAFDEA